VASYIVVFARQAYNTTLDSKNYMLWRWIIIIDDDHHHHSHDHQFSLPLSLTARKWASLPVDELNRGGLELRWQ